MKTHQILFGGIFLVSLWQVKGWRDMTDTFLYCFAKGTKPKHSCMKENIHL